MPRRARSVPPALQTVTQPQTPSAEFRIKARSYAPRMLGAVSELQRGLAVSPHPWGHTEPPGDARGAEGLPPSHPASLCVLLGQEQSSCTLVPARNINLFFPLQEEGHHSCHWSPQRLTSRSTGCAGTGSERSGTVRV